jgi:hypothetical protein
MEGSASPARRPGGVTAVGMILYIVALLNLLSGVALLVTDAVSDAGRPLADFESFVAILLIAWGALLLLVARGITTGSNFARVIWVVLMGFEVLAGVSSLVQGYIGVGLVATILPLFLMYLVFTPSAEAFFAPDG